MAQRVDKTNNYDIFIGRPSKFGNPFKSGVDGTRSEVIAKFEAYLRAHPEIDKLLEELEGKTFACWCGLDEKCHGDVYLSLLKERNYKKHVNDLFEY